MTDADNTYQGEHRIMYRIVQTMLYTPETEITSYVNYTSITNFKKKVQ